MVRSRVQGPNSSIDQASPRYLRTPQVCRAAGVPSIDRKLYVGGGDLFSVNAAGRHQGPPAGVFQHASSQEARRSVSLVAVDCRRVRCFLAAPVSGAARPTRRGGATGGSVTCLVAHWEACLHSPAGPALLLLARIEFVAAAGDGSKFRIRGRDARRLPHDLFVESELDDRAVNFDERRTKSQKPWWRRTPLDQWNVSTRVQYVACLPLAALVLALWLLPKLFAAGWDWRSAEPWCSLLALLCWPPVWFWLIRRYGRPDDAGTG
jgi:hypothetical protein